MRKKFVRTSNVKAFMAGVEVVKTRGAPEASWLLAEGTPGLGKTATLVWWSTQKDSILIRAKKGWTVNWALRDLMTHLGEAHARSTEVMFNGAVRAISQSEQPIMVDEIQHAMHGGIIEVLRDISDYTETPIIIGGHNGVGATLKRFEQISSRIAYTAQFNASTVADVRLICDELAEVKVSNEQVEQLHRETGGSMRRLLNGIARLEQAERRRVA